MDSSRTRPSLLHLPSHDQIIDQGILTLPPELRLPHWRGVEGIPESPDIVQPAKRRGGKQPRVGAFRFAISAVGDGV